ncbi:MAG: adenylosuccinate synthase [Candidatus Nealsonbacteria bacterium]|nr:adenylosuccinate synthase [Candidatus Nealsonbacteria bacterium]
MPVTVVLGAQWGDEGKGKITDFLAKKADVCVRFSGGDNAGHTVINKRGEFKLHLIPCGIFNPETLCIIGNGVAVNPNVLIGEMAALEQRGVSCKNLRISSKAHLIMPWHLALDGLQEEERGEGKIGTTKRGIGPVFSDKIGRFGLRVEDLFAENMEQKLRKLRERSATLLLMVYGYKSYDLMYDVILKNLLDFKNRISPFVTETEPVLWEACDQKKRILMEGAQGIMLDPDFGTYPETTSSPCTLASALQGSGISWMEIKEVIGVVKAYTTRVCEKNIPFKTEMPSAIADPFREHTKEYGATTNRPRRIGWLDASYLRYAARINGFTGLAVTRMDSLGTFHFSGGKVKIWDGNKYLEMPGKWGRDIKHLNAILFLQAVEKLAGVRVKYISYGPEREQVAIVKNRFLF